ncbi:MAG: sodium ion-translocating decarboxylase subunit beta, partial [Bacillota bacterium]|nr:sodium ion-translocating decarboxylase subunit beta [Bacillota bacterium]
MLQTIKEFYMTTGFDNMTGPQMIMIGVSFFLLYLAIRKGFEPLLLVPIAFGMFLTNLPEAGMMTPPVYAADGSLSQVGGLLYYLYQGNKLGIFPPLIFLGVGAMTDFGPLIANPKSLLLGAAAQFGIFVTFFGAIASGLFTPAEAASIGIIGGADGPTAIFLSSKLAPHIMGSIAVAAYSYMALVPVIQPPIMKLLTTKEERQIKMKQLRHVSKLEKIVFPILGTLIVSLIVPPAGALIGMLMLGNLFKESGVVGRLSDTAQNAMMNIVTIFLGVTVGATASAEAFIKVETLAIVGLGVVAFAIGTAAGVLLAKLMNLFVKDKVNP